MAPWRDKESGNEKNPEANGQNGTSDKKAKTIDDILDTYVGRLGWFQLYVGLIINYGLSCMGTGVYASIFTDYPPKFHCASMDDGEGNLVEVEEFSVDHWQNNTDTCTNYNGTACQEFVYDTEIFYSSATADFDIVCDDKYLKTLSGVLRMSGMLFGSFFFGWFSDKVGRVPSLTLSGLTLFLAQALNVFSTNYLMYSILQLFQAGAGLACYITSFVILFEWISPVFRTPVCVLSQIPFAMGFLYVVFMGYFVRTWRVLQIVLAAPNLIYVIFPCILPESPRWLATKGSMDKARQKLENAAKMNNSTIPGDIEIFVDTTSSTETLDIRDMVRYPFLLSRLIIMSLNWMVITLCFYGLSLNSANNEQFFGSMAAMAAAEIPGYIGAAVIMETFGRRPVLSFCQILAGISCVVAGFIPVSIPWLRLALAVLGKMGCSAGFAVVYVYTAEIFPTQLRNSAMGMCSTVARIGGLAAPVIAGMEYIYAPLPFLIMGGTSIIVGIMAFLLPESRGVPLPQTLAEAKAIK